MGQGGSTQYTFNGWSGVARMENNEPPLMQCYSSPKKARLTAEVLDMPLFVTVILNPTASRQTSIALVCCSSFLYDASQIGVDGWWGSAGTGGPQATIGTI